MMSNLRTGITKQILFVLIGSLLSAGCLREKTSGCSEGFILKFNYVTPSGLPVITEIPETDYLSVFIFDENGVFLDKEEVTAEGLTTDYQMNLPFYEGIYQFVVWAGLSPCYRLPESIPGQTRLQEFNLHVRQTDGNISSQPLTPLYFGSHPLVEANPSSTTVVDIGIHQLTNRVLVAIHHTDAEPQPEIRISDNNGTYNYLGEIVPSDTLTYLPYNLQYTEATSTWTADFTVMRLDSESKALLTIKNEPGIPEFTADLVRELLNANPYLNFDTDHDFTIEITFGYSNIPVSITVNGWEIILDNTAFFSFLSD